LKREKVSEEIIKSVKGWNKKGGTGKALVLSLEERGIFVKSRIACVLIRGLERFG